MRPITKVTSTMPTKATICVQLILFVFPFSFHSMWTFPLPLHYQWSETVTGENLRR